MADVKTFSTEETIALIKAKAADPNHLDSFQVKIQRRKAIAGFGGASELIAVLEGATIAQICNPELWLPRLVGGGNYILKVFSPLDPGKQLGGDFVYQFTGDQRQVDPQVLRASGWVGPTELKYPEFGPQVPTPFMTLANAPPMTVPHTVTQAPTAANTIVAGPSQLEIELKEVLRATQQQLAAVQSQAAQRDRELAEERAARREEMLRREQSTAVAALEAKIDRLASAQPAKSPIDAIAPLVTAVMPLVQAMVQSSAETRQIMLKSQQDSQTQFQTIMLKSMEKPAVDPQITMLMDRFQQALDKLREGDPSRDNMIAQMSDAFGGMANMMVGVLGQVTESFGKQGDSTGMMIVKEIAKMVEAFGRASSKVAKPQRRLPVPVQRQVPVGATATAPQQPIVTPAPAPSNGLAGVPNPLDEIEARIRSEEDPKAIAAALIALVNDATVQAEINAAGGLMEVFRDRLGDDWAAGNMEYAQALLSEIQEKAIAAGILVEDGEPETVEGEVQQ